MHERQPVSSSVDPLVSLVVCEQWNRGWSLGDGAHFGSGGEGGMPVLQILDKSKLLLSGPRLSHPLSVL
jgi:hypothetical protein